MPEDRELPLGNLKEENEDSEYLHMNIITNSDRQNSSQGSVYYVKLEESVSHEIALRDFVLKVYLNTKKRSYNKEITVMECLQKRQREDP